MLEDIEAEELPESTTTLQVSPPPNTAARKILDDALRQQGQTNTTRRTLALPPSPATTSDAAAPTSERAPDEARALIDERLARARNARIATPQGAAADRPAAQRSGGGEGAKQLGTSTATAQHGGWILGDRAAEAASQPAAQVPFSSISSSVSKRDVLGERMHSSHRHEQQQQQQQQPPPRPPQLPHEAEHERARHHLEPPSLLHSPSGSEFSEWSLPEEDDHQGGGGSTRWGVAYGSNYYHAGSGGDGVSQAGHAAYAHSSADVYRAPPALPSSSSASNQREDGGGGGGGGAESRTGTNRVPDSRIPPRRPLLPARREPLLKLYGALDPPLSILDPAPKGMMVQCVVRREMPLVGRLGGSPTYILSVQTAKGDAFLLAAKRRPKVSSHHASPPIPLHSYTFLLPSPLALPRLASPQVNKAKGQSYLISRSQSDLSKGTNFVAKLKGNFLGTEWVLYDDGLKPHEAVALARQQQQATMGGGGGKRDRGLSATALPLDALPAVHQPRGKLGGRSRTRSLLGRGSPFKGGNHSLIVDSSSGGGGAKRPSEITPTGGGGGGGRGGDGGGDGGGGGGGGSGGGGGGAAGNTANLDVTPALLVGSSSTRSRP